MLPETLTVLPLYLLSIIKRPAFKLLTACRLDNKIQETYKLVSMSMETLTYVLYPRVYPVQDIGESEDYGHTSEETQLIVKPVLTACRQSAKQLY